MSILVFVYLSPQTLTPESRIEMAGDGVLVFRSYSTNGALRDAAQSLPVRAWYMRCRESSARHLGARCASSTSGTRARHLLPFRGAIRKLGLARKGIDLNQPLVLHKCDGTQNRPNLRLLAEQNDGIPIFVEPPMEKPAPGGAIIHYFGHWRLSRQAPVSFRTYSVTRPDGSRDNCCGTATFEFDHFEVK